MADDTTKFTLDLDSTQFMSKMDQAISAMEGLSGKTGEISGLLSALEGLGPVLGVIAVAAATLGSAFEAVFTTEHIEAVNKQFEFLTKNAGVFTDDLKKGLVEAAHGWATETELMEATNKVMLGLESGVSRIPELMNVARSAAIAMGGTMIERFEQISRSVETGNTRYLRHMNIIVDQNKAYEDYAKKVGTVVSALSLAEKQQAVLNAILDQTKDKLIPMSEGLNKTSEIWNKLKTDVKEFGERIAESIGSVATPIIRGLLVATDDLLHVLTNVGQGNLKFWKADFWHDQKVSIDGVTQSINKQSEALKDQGKAAPQDTEKRAAQEAKAAKGLESIQNQLIQEQIKSMNTLEEAHRLYDVERINAAQKIANEEKAIMADKNLTESQKEQQLATLHQVMNEKIQKDDDKLAQYEIKAAENRLSTETRVDQQIANSAQVNGLKAADAWKKAGGVGGVAVGSFQSHAVTAFQQMGSGAKSAADAMKDAFMGMLGDMATKQGEFMMLDAFKTFPAINAPEFAAGAALVALGGALGASASSSASSSGGGGGSVGASTVTPTAAAPLTSMATQQQKVSTNLIIQGHMLTDDRTARWIVDQVRAAADTTDFKIQSIGGGL